jgi:hypothetical protein
MLYAILCYHDEDTVGSWSKEQDAAVMKKLAVVQDKLTKQGRLGPVARLLPTTSATTLRKDDPPVVIDGPYAETKEQLGGILILEANDLNHAIQLMSKHPGVRMGPFEIRPAADLTGMIRESERRRAKIKA